MNTVDLDDGKAQRVAKSSGATAGACGCEANDHPSKPSGQALFSIAAYFNPQRSQSGADSRELENRFERKTQFAGTEPADAAAQLDAASGDATDSRYPADLDLWADRLDVTREQLRAAIRRVGSRVDDVTRYLGNPDIL